MNLNINEAKERIQFDQIHPFYDDYTILLNQILLHVYFRVLSKNNQPKR